MCGIHGHATFIDFLAIFVLALVQWQPTSAGLKYDTDTGGDFDADVIHASDS